MDVPPFVTEEHSPLKDLRNTSMDGSANLKDNQTNNPNTNDTKRKSVQSWYGRMSDEKKAEYNMKRRISRQQKKVATLDCASQDQFSQKFVSLLRIVQPTPFSDIINTHTKGTCVTSTASISANTPQMHTSDTCVTSAAPISANTPQTPASAEGDVVQRVCTSIAYFTYRSTVVGSASNCGYNSKVNQYVINNWHILAAYEVQIEYMNWTDEATKLMHAWDIRSDVIPSGERGQENPEKLQLKVALEVVPGSSNVGSGLEERKRWLGRAQEAVAQRSGAAGPGEVEELVTGRKIVGGGSEEVITPGAARAAREETIIELA
ncbi:uncharacterized protein LOC125551597 isoform X2 [Triticum urartu]|nr:uncharacterized protein LOC125551597 isoform X2 [Triticum urartu]